LRRLLDVIMAATGLIICGPAMLVIGLAIFMSDRGPVFFSQRRLGLNGRPFRMYKFRKFAKQHGASGCPLTVRNDDRMTPLGRVLGRTKLDELPQLWNVLKGDMSIVGPRPESLEFADCYVDPYRDVLNYKPGIFGPSQTLFRDECLMFPDGADPRQFYRAVLFPMKARFDLSYYSKRTIRSDLVWLVRAVLAVVGFHRLSALPKALKGAHGFAPELWAHRDRESRVQFDDAASGKSRAP
jgi:lipopolysaccharide/colanic/teichoic acid biosynthesis glycosyltransferase